MARSGQTHTAGKPVRRRFALSAARISEIEKLRAEVRLEEGGSESWQEAGGQCGIVSECVAGLLQDQGVEASEYWGGAYQLADDTICFDHCWVELADGTILDATADQFAEGDSVRLVRPGTPLHSRYLQWQEIENVLADLRARAARIGTRQVLEEISCFDVKVGVFGDTYAAEYRALITELTG